jgi:zinc/manganese transport system substrate-binding protein
VELVGGVVGRVETRGRILDAAAQRLVRIAQQVKIPVVGVTETEPAGTTFQNWMTGDLNAVSDALSNPS